MTGATDPTGILYVATSAKIGGGNRVVMDLIDGLDRRRFRPFIVSPDTGPLTDWATTAGVPWEICAAGDMNGRVGLWRRAVKLAVLIVRHRIGVVHAVAHTSYRSAGLAARLTHTACVCHLGFPPTADELKWSFRFGPDVAIACYEGQAREIELLTKSLGLRCKVVAIPNGIDLHAYSEEPQLGQLDDARWRFNARHVVAIVGHLSEVKGYPIFLEAAARISAELNDCIFLAIGAETLVDGYRATLEGRARELGLGDRVKFLGWQSNVAEIIRQVDVMVLPSLAEGLPLAILEAMACARPVVATAVGGVPEAVVNGVTGYLVPAGVAAPVADATLALLRDTALARQMGEAGRLRVREHFSLARSVASVESLYSALVTANAER